MATIDGARALGLGGEIGSIETGKRADLTLVSVNRPHMTPHPDPVSSIVYAAEASDVETVLIDGRVVMLAGELTTLDEQAIIQAAKEKSEQLGQSSRLKSLLP